MNVAEATERRYAKTVRTVRGMLTIANFLASLVRDEDKLMQLFWSDDPYVVSRRLPDHCKLALYGDEFYADPARDAFPAYIEELIGEDSDIGGLDRCWCRVASDCTR